MWENSVLVKLLYFYDSTKNKLLLSYFIRKYFELLMAAFGISEELIATLKNYYGKERSLPETTLKYLCKLHKED